MSLTALLKQLSHCTSQLNRDARETASKDFWRLANLLQEFAELAVEFPDQFHDTKVESIPPLSGDEEFCLKFNGFHPMSTELHPLVAEIAKYARIASSEADLYEVKYGFSSTFETDRENPLLRERWETFPELEKIPDAEQANYLFRSLWQGMTKRRIQQELTTEVLYGLPHYQDYLLRRNAFVGDLLPLTRNLGVQSSVLIDPENPQLTFVDSFSIGRHDAALLTALPEGAYFHSFGLYGTAPERKGNELVVSGEPFQKSNHFWCKSRFDAADTAPDFVALQDRACATVGIQITPEIISLAYGGRANGGRQ